MYPSFHQSPIAINFKMKQYIFISALFICALITGCKKDAILPTPDKKLVINGQISPADDSIKVKVDYSVPINTNGSTVNIFSEATVTLSDGTTTIKLAKLNRPGIFGIRQADFKLVPGTVYHLYVNDGHGREVTAETSIPYAVTNTVYSVLGETPAKNGRVKYASRFKFDDHLNTLHLYRLYSGQTAPLFTPQEELYGDDLEELKTFAGTAEIVVEESRYLIFPSSVAVSSKQGYFISCSNEYYRFYKSLDNTEGNNEPDLLQEPANIYTNIKGGLGIFGGYNIVKTVSQ